MDFIELFWVCALWYIARFGLRSHFSTHMCLWFIFVFTNFLLILLIHLFRIILYQRKNIYLINLKNYTCSVPAHTHREMYSKSCWINPNLTCNYLFPTDLQPKWIQFDVKSIGKWLITIIIWFESTIVREDFSVYTLYIDSKDSWAQIYSHYSILIAIISCSIHIWLFLTQTRSTSTKYLGFTECAGTGKLQKYSLHFTLLQLQQNWNILCSRTLFGQKKQVLFSSLCLLFLALYYTDLISSLYPLFLALCFKVLISSLILSIML